MIPLPNGGDDPLLGIHVLPLEPWQMVVVGVVLGLVALWVLAYMLLAHYGRGRH